MSVNHHADTIFFTGLQLVGDLVRYLQNIMLTPSSPSSAYRQYAISPNTCQIACWHPLLYSMLTESIWSHLIPVEWDANVVFPFSPLTECSKGCSHHPTCTSGQICEYPWVTISLFISIAVYLWDEGNPHKSSFQAPAADLVIIDTVVCIYVIQLLPDDAVAAQPAVLAISASIIE